MTPINEDQLRLQLRLLGHKGLWTLCHAQNVQTKKVISREIFNHEEEIIQWARKQNGSGNLFLGRAARENPQGTTYTTRCLSLDIDPIRDKDTASTDEQHQAALDAGRKVIQHLHYGVLCSSGNGSLVLFPLRDSLDKDMAERYGKFLEDEARKILQGRPVNVDSTWDAPRLVKAMGCLSTKGDKSLWRYSRIIANCGGNGIQRFHKWLESAPQSDIRPRFLPEISKGSLDRSKADMALAARLKLQGFSATDAYNSLVAYGFRPGREDDYRRIISKVYESEGQHSPLVSGGNGGEAARPIQLITPESGLAEYKNRQATGEPELPTGFREIDRATFGLIRGSIFTVGARTNCGKSTFAVGAALHLCQRGKSVLFLSTETTYQEIWDRYIAAGTGVGAFALQHGFRLNGHQRDVDTFLEEFKGHRLYVYDGSRPNIHTVRQIVDQAKPDVLIFDYFQHVESRDTKQLEEFVMNLKDLAKERNFAALMLAQLHDRYNPQTGKQYPPTLQDMKSCKVMNDESRVVLLLDWDRDAVQGDGPAAVKVIMAKNKGPKADIVLKLDRSVPRFVEAD